MAGKAITYFLIIFFALVVADWVLTSIATGLRNLHLNFAINDYGYVSSNGLAEVDFAFFSQKENRNYITQGYGYTSFSYNYISDWHNGIDIIAKYGAPVLAAASGEVISTGNQDNYCYRRGFGKFIAVKNDALGLVLFYAHLGKVSVAAGENIKNGQEIGEVGSSGFETGTHLHFSVFDAKNFQIKNKNGCGPGPDGRDLNPMNYLDKFRAAFAIHRATTA